MVIKRSFIDNVHTDIPFTLYDSDRAFVATLKLPAGDDYGFIRLGKNNGVWTVDPNYQINLTRTDYDYSSNTTIGTKTYPTNADIWIGNNVTLTFTGTASFQPGTTVHLGVGSVIQTTGSGNIQATGTVFKTLSGSNDPSDRWLHIILKGDGGSSFTQCTFNGASQAIYVDSQGNTVDRCTFQYNSCGLYAWTGSAYIDGSVFSNNPDFGIYEGGTGYSQLFGYQTGSTFIPNTISGSSFGVYLYDNAWGVLKNTQVDGNTYGVINYDGSMLQAGNHNDSGGNPNYVGYGWNRFSLNDSYAVYNGSSQTDWANDNWWNSVSGPSPSRLYGDVNYAYYLNYDPTINGGPHSQAAPSMLEVMGKATTSKTLAASRTTSGSLSSNGQQNTSNRLSAIYTQLSKNPDDPGNYRLLQEAYGLVQLDEPADSSSLLRKLEAYTGQFRTALLQASGTTSSPALSQAALQMGTTAVR